MRKILFLPILFFTLNSFSQNYVSVNYTQIFSNFIFKNSDGERDKTLKSDLKSAYALNYQKVFKKSFFVRGEFGYKTFGALSILNNQKLAWNLNYLDLNIGGGYIINNFKIKPYVGAAFYGSYLIRANQTIGENYYDMLQNNSIKKNDYGVNVYLGAIHSFSDFASIYVEVAQTRGLNQLETSSNQKLYNTAISVRLGLMFLIGKTDNKYGFMFKK
jgi:hypothetical protein